MCVCVCVQPQGFQRFFSFRCSFFMVHLLLSPFLIAFIIFSLKLPNYLLCFCNLSIYNPFLSVKIYSRISFLIKTPNFSFYQNKNHLFSSFLRFFLAFKRMHFCWFCRILLNDLCFCQTFFII